MPDAQLCIALQNSLSVARLSKYRAAANGNLPRALALYEHNMRLSETFYTPLQCLEICLRNTMHDALTAAYGAAWYAEPSLDLSAGIRTHIAKAERELGRGHHPAVQGTVVAELSFGVWVALLSTGYDATLWRRALAPSFRVNGRSLRRDIVHGRMNALRRFRNRVAHHEPIFHKNLSGVHTELIEAIGWMCPVTATWTGGISQASAAMAVPAG